MLYFAQMIYGGKQLGYTVASLKKGPVPIVPLGWALTATFVLLYVLCWVAAMMREELARHGLNL
jgi:hypothetical protein